MARLKTNHLRSVLTLIVVSSFLAGCGGSADSRFFGKTEAPKDNVLRYISGSEPESLDPQVPTGQPEARVLLALFDGLVEYHPKTMEPIPGIAESWEVNPDGSEYLFRLRRNAKFSNGDPITAEDFVYTFRRGFSPELAAQNAYLGYYIKYSEPYNAGKSFVKDKDGKFLLKKDFEEDAPPETVPAAPDTFGGDTEFHRFLDGPERLAVDGSPLALARQIERTEKLKPHFKLSAADIKDGPAVVSKLSGPNDFAAYLKPKLDAAALAACAADCPESARQAIADGLNAAMDGEGFHSLKLFQFMLISETAKEIVEKVKAENRKISDENALLDEELATIADPAEKEAKAKKRKKNIDKLFYINRLLVEDFFGESIAKAPLVPVRAEDLGVEAVDEDNDPATPSYTFRIKLLQSAPFFLGLLPHQFFRVVHRGTIEKFGKDWTKPSNIVTSGAFRLKSYRPYDEIVVEKDPGYWDADNVKLAGIEFYPMEEATTMMNLYKAGKVHAVYNHVPPAPWNEIVKQYKDEYLNFPEVAIEYYTFNVTKPPMDDVKVRQAFALAVDREALSKFRKTTQPLVDFTPEGIFPKYEEARTKVYTEKLAKQGTSLEAWKARIFDLKKACDLMKQAGYDASLDASGRCRVTNFPVEKIKVTYNTAESNKAVAEFLQAQWKQNLGITISLHNMEWKTFLKVRKSLDYVGMARAGWVGDYMDPFTFLALFYKENNDSSTGWHDPKFDKLLDDANKELDEMKRFEMLAEAELYMMQAQPVVPLQTQATNWIKKPFVKGLYPNPGTLHAWKFVYIEQDPGKWDRNVDNIMKERDPAVYEQVDKLWEKQRKK